MECSHRQQPNGDYKEGDKVMMKDRQWARLAGVSGILFVVLVYAGVFLVDTGILGGLGEPPPDAGGEEFIAYFTSSHAALLLKSYLGLCRGPMQRRVGGLRTTTDARIGGLWQRSNGKCFAIGIDGGDVGTGA
jgi:hypothetical protein